MVTLAQITVKGVVLGILVIDIPPKLECFYHGLVVPNYEEAFKWTFLLLQFLYMGVKTLGYIERSDSFTLFVKKIKLEIIPYMHLTNILVVSNYLQIICRILNLKLKML